MKIRISVYVFLFLLLGCLICSEERNRYIIHIEQALQAGHFDEQFETIHHPGLRREVEQLLLQIYETEKAHPDFIQCVTAQDSFFYAYQVIAKELYRKLCDIPREDFEFLRFQTQNLIKNRDEFFLRYPSLFLSKEDIAKEFKTSADQLENKIECYENQDEEGCVRIAKEEAQTLKGFNKIEWEKRKEEEIFSRIEMNDTLSEISRELLSVNFTMETYRPLDSAMFVFLSGNAISLSSLSKDEEEYQRKIYHIVYQLFDSLFIPKEKYENYVQKLIKNAPHTKLGIINQIFIPKENAANFLYLSFGKGFLHLVNDSKFEESYLEFQKNRQERFFRTYRNYQARIIAGSLFEDPRVKIFRYSLIPKDAQDQYEAFVRQTIDEMLCCQ